MKYYIDFDNTIFNTVDFYNDIKKLLIRHYVPKEFIDKYDNLVQLVNDASRIYDTKIIDEVNKVYQKSSDYIYEDFYDFYKRHASDELILFTFGYRDYQEIKINNTNMKDYFKEIIISTVPKHLLNIDYKEGIFIDDNLVNLNNYLNRGSKKVIRIMRKNNRHSYEINDNKLIIEMENMNDI